MRISDWSSDVCSSDLIGLHALFDPRPGTPHSENSPGENSPSENSLPPRLAALAGALDAHLADIHEAPAPHRLRSLAASIALLLAAGTAGWVAWEQVAPDHDSLVALTRHASEASLQSAGDANSGAVPAAQRPAVGEPQVVAWLAAQPGNVQIGRAHV